MNIVIGQPTIDSVEAITQFDLINMIFTTKGHSIHFIPSIGTTVIHEARNFIVKEAYKIGFDAILFIDADMTFEPKTLNKLINSNKDICGVRYVGKCTNKQNVFMYNNGNFGRISLSSGVGLVQVGAVGAGILFIKKEVFDVIRSPYFFYETGIGEDVSFCKRAINAGFEIFVNTDIEVGHIGKEIKRA